MFSPVRRGSGPRCPEPNPPPELKLWSLQLAGNNTHKEFFPPVHPPAACPHRLGDITDLSAGSAALAACRAGKGAMWQGGLPRGPGGKLRD